VQRIRNGSIVNAVYDPKTARLVETTAQPSPGR